jgi:hypothetical protein
MYVAMLALHSLLRWAVLLIGLSAVVRAFSGWRGRRPWTREDHRAGGWFVIAMDVQFLIGLLLYGLLSPITRSAFQDFGAAMRDSALRFWAVEHIFGMVVALALVHIGRARSKRSGPDERRHRAAAIFYALAIAIIVLTTPWPFMPNARPWIRFIAF